MKLTNFYHFAPLNDLKERMGIPLNVYGDLNVNVTASRLTIDELNKLYEGEGLEVSFDEVEVFNDGTLIYKGNRVLLYIRDVFSYQEKIDLPKFHVANCKTLRSMSDLGRSHRYLISARVDGIFHLNVARRNRVAVETSPLNVCQNCLAALEFDGFQNNFGKRDRSRYVEAFTPEKFFEQYPRQMDSSAFGYAEFAPLNAYSPDFSRTSYELKTAVGWKCQEIRCGYDCSELELRKYLHVHHVNANRSNNSPSNLRAICIECHSKQPMHVHMRNSPQLKEFRQRRYGR